MEVSPEYLNLPKTFVVKSREIEFGSGLKKASFNLENSKKTKDGLIIKEIEVSQTNISLEGSVSVDELQHAYEELVENRDILRNFYYSKKRVKLKRKVELQKRKFVDKLFSKERKYVSKGKKCRTIMFVGDRGYGLGSSIRGHL